MKKILPRLALLAAPFLVYFAESVYHRLGEARP